MITLFETFTDESATLYHSLKQSEIYHQTAVIEDDGFLPDDVITPYLFFSNFIPLKKENGRYFNEVTTPLYWEIEGTNNQGTIKDMGKLRGRIFYCRNNKNRIVNRVDWLDEEGDVRAVDHYNKYGFKFATQVFNKAGQSVLKTFYDRNGKVIIYENHFTQSIVLTYKEKDYLFKNKIEFVQFFLKEAFDQLDGFILNSLSVPFIAVYHLELPGKDYLFWQETIQDDIPGNMKLMFESPNRDFTAVIPDKLEYERILSVVNHSVKHKIKSAGYLYKYMKKAQMGEQILTLTNSDQLEDIERYINELPQYTFNVAAVTEMSPKLMELGKYHNVKLYPSVKRDTVMKLYKESNIYLDINHSNEILNAVRSAFDFNMLILAHNNTAHNRRFTAPEHIYEQTEDNIRQLNLLHERPDIFMDLLKKQKEHANEMTVEQFNKIFN